MFDDDCYNYLFRIYNFTIEVISMKKLLLALSLIALPLTANISWNREKKMYCSNNFLWDNKFNEQKYHEMAILFNQIVGYGIINEGSVWCLPMIDFFRFLRDDASPEAFVLSHDIEEFLEQYDELD